MRAPTSLSVLSLLAFTPAALAQESIPSVVVTVENAQPDRGVFLTPPWIGIHDGTFDTYDGGQLASVPLGGNEIEALAEDGNNAPLTATFSMLQPGAPQVEGVAGPSGPLAPGTSVSVTLNVNPQMHRYFSYASMVIPSNDAFIANGNPLAHQLFNDAGEFVGAPFVVSGDETNDAGTEVNDEIATNVAFLAQGGPNIGQPEALPVTTPSPGFAAAGSLAFPNGVLNHPAFALADFNDAEDRVFRVSFRYVDLGGVVRFASELSPAQEIQADEVVSEGSAVSQAVAVDGKRFGIFAQAGDLSGPITAAHLHLGAAGTDGPVIVDLGAGITGQNIVRLLVDETSLTGPLQGAPMVDFLNQLAAGNVYLNLHTTQFPGGEVRGQLVLQ